MSVIAGMLKRGSWTNAGEELVMESTGRRGPKVQSLEGQYSASRALGACSTRRSLTLPPIHLPAVASIPLAVPICVGYEQEMIAPRFISCIFILQSLLGSVGFPDYQYLKIYVLFPGLFLVLPSSYMKIPPPTYLWDSWSCREHFTPLLKLLWCIVRPLASQPPRPRGAGCALAPPLFWVGTSVVTAVPGERWPWSGLISKRFEVQGLSPRREDDTRTIGHRAQLSLYQAVPPSFIPEWTAVAKWLSILEPLNQISSDLNFFQLV